MAASNVRATKRRWWQTTVGALLLALVLGLVLPCAGSLIAFMAIGGGNTLPPPNDPEVPLVLDRACGAIKGREDPRTNSDGPGFVSDLQVLEAWAAHSATHGRISYCVFSAPSYPTGTTAASTVTVTFVDGTETRWEAELLYTEAYHSRPQWRFTSLPPATVFPAPSVTPTPRPAFLAPTATAGTHK